MLAALLEAVAARASGAGRGMFSMRREGDLGDRDRQWLEELQGVDLPPLDTLLQTCLLRPIQDQVQSYCSAVSA